MHQLELERIQLGKKFEESWYQERELWPEINEITVGKDGVGFTKFFIDKAHDKW